MAEQDGSLNYEELIMAGLTPPENFPVDQAYGFVENLHYVLEKISPDLLRPENKALLQCMSVFRDETDNKGPLDEESLVDMLIHERASPETQIKYQELFHRYSTMDVGPAKFRFAVSRFLKAKEQESFIKALGDAFTIQTVGMKYGREELKGYQDAKRFLQERMFDIERGSSSNYVPEGDIREETDDIIRDMEERKLSPDKFVGVKCGVAPLDEITNGVQPGELGIIGGFTEVGKSFFTLQWAHHGCTEQGFNIAIGTAEVVYHQYRRRLALRHARNALFQLPQGIDSDAFKHGRLTPQEENAFREAMRDLKTNPKYGRFYLFQIPKGANWPWVTNKLNAINARWQHIGGLKAAFIDSLNLISTGGKPGDKRNYTNELIKEAKQTAVNFDRGRGIPIISPWHANRKSWEEAIKNGSYTLASWSEADELEKSADLLMWLLKLQNAQNSREILAGVEKYRDGKGKQRFTLYEDFASSYMGTVASANSTIPASMGQMPGPNGAQPEDRAAGLF
jgi:replicative DNA helicase